MYNSIFFNYNLNLLKIFSAIISTNNVSCNGGSDGSAMVGSIGGTAPYTYLWDNNQSNNLAVGLSSGNYSVTTIDANGCLSTTNANIYEPSFNVYHYRK